MTKGDIVYYRVDREKDGPVSWTIEDELPAVVTAIHEYGIVNLKILCDGPGDVWKEKVRPGLDPGCWRLVPPPIKNTTVLADRVSTPPLI